MSETPATSNEGPTGAILYDLPSPYLAHCPTGLLHLPRFIAKIRKHLAGELPASYQRNFCRGFDGLLCTHLGIDPKEVVELARKHGDDHEAFEAALMDMLPKDVKAPKWNRELVQKGMSEMGREAVKQAKTNMGIADRDDIVGFADIIEIDEGRIK